MRRLLRSLTTGQLRRVGRRLAAARTELAQVTAQAEILVDEADDLDLRALVSDSPLDRSEAAAAGGHRAAMRREQQRLADLIGHLEARQDRLLDRLGSR